MNNSKAIRVLQYNTAKEGYDLEFDKFDGTNDLIVEKKSKILSMMGGKPIIEKEEAVSIKVDDEVKDLGYSQYLRLLIETPYFKNIYVLRRFIRDCGAITFYDNKTTEDLSYKVVSSKGNEEIIRIPQGMKITRALKFFTCGDEKLLNMLQTKYSQIINTSDIGGKLCISVDPMDFLTMSVNNNNWRSCMALDGEYASGTLSYAADAYTIMVYLKSDKEDENLKDVPNDIKWNSKKWRCLMYFDKDYNMLLSTKQYPFTSTQLMEQATKFVKETLHLENYEYKKANSIYDYNVSLGSKGLIFNDLEANNNSKMIIHSLIKKGYENVHTVVCPGEDVLCPNCGAGLIDYGGSFICSECADRSICENCGGPIAHDDERYLVDDMEICEDCMTESCVVCDCCYEAFWSDDPDIVYTEDGMVYCSCCFDSLD